MPLLVVACMISRARTASGGVQYPIVRSTSFSFFAARAGRPKQMQEDACVRPFFVFCLFKKYIICIDLWLSYDSVVLNVTQSVQIIIIIIVMMGFLLCMHTSTSTSTDMMKTTYHIIPSYTLTTTVIDKSRIR